VLGRNRSYFVQNHSDSTKMFSETDIINILEFLIDNIFVIFGGRVFQQTIDHQN
jgi:dihydrofolate reductase